MTIPKGRNAVSAKKGVSIDDETSAASLTRSSSSESLEATDFHHVDVPVIHDLRRKEMLKRYPQIANLYGYDHGSAVFCTFTVLLQFLCVYLFHDLSWGYLTLATYFVSGTLNHSIVLGMHELSHNCFFKSPKWNKFFGFFANLPIGLPMAITFKRYHSEHHWGLSVDGIDVDLPHPSEARLFKGVLGRLVWMVLQPFFYTLRPVVVKPKHLTMDEVMNWVVQLSFNVVITSLFGVKGMFYLLAGSLLGMGLHPISGHFVAEHFEFFPGQETASYYGPINWITYNVGWHVEHHDFPRIPGRRLPELHKIAPEFYKDLKYHTSWCKVLYDFIFGGKLTLFSRMIRTNPEGSVGVAPDGTDATDFAEVDFGYGKKKTK